MTFTAYLRRLDRSGRASPLWACVDRESWPKRSVRLEDYEAFVRRYIGGAQLEAIPELRAHWAEWSAEEGRGGQTDLVLAAWRDYALHLRDCELMRMVPCPRAEELLSKAIGESRFRDLDINEPDPIPCESPSAAFARAVKQLLDQFLKSPSVRRFTPEEVLAELRRTHTTLTPRSKS